MDKHLILHYAAKFLKKASTVDPREWTAEWAADLDIPFGNPQDIPEPIAQAKELSEEHPTQQTTSAPLENPTEWFSDTTISDEDVEDITGKDDSMRDVLDRLEELSTVALNAHKVNNTVFYKAALKASEVFGMDIRIALQLVVNHYSSQHEIPPELKINDPVTQEDIDIANANMVSINRVANLAKIIRKLALTQMLRFNIISK